MMTKKDTFNPASSLLTAEDIWFKCNLYLRFIPSINLWKICIDLRPLSKCFRVPFLKTLRLPKLHLNFDKVFGNFGLR